MDEYVSEDGMFQVAVSDTHDRAGTTERTPDGGLVVGGPYVRVPNPNDPDPDEAA